MERNILILLLLALCIGFGAGIFYNLDSRNAESEQILFVHADNRGDDYGPGTYIYPTHQHFAPHEGLFDLLHFTVLAGEEYYQFLLTFKHITNPWQARYGFSHQLIQIYIDNGPGGSTQTLIPGANVAFSEKSPWNHLIKASGWGADLYRPGEDPDVVSRGERVMIQLVEGEDTIRIQIPMEELGSLADASYYVLIGSFDVFGKDNYREVNKEVGTWYLGGGDDSIYNPNVIDMVTPSHLCQKEMLGNWSAQEEELAVLYPVGERRDLMQFFRLAGFFFLFILALILFLYWKPSPRPIL